MKLEFGTAGIRAIVGQNENQLNEAHAARIFEAYAQYLNNEFKSVKNKSIVIGRDNRIKGKEFTRLAANILTSHGIKVYFDDQMHATPFISFLVIYKKALGAINVTASHNPKEYNGIKLYNQFGYQMLPNEIEKVKKYFKDYHLYTKYMKQKIKVNESKRILKISKKDLQYYLDQIIALVPKKINLSNIKVVYSSLHGTGYKYIKEIFKKLKVDVAYEKNEIIEDPNFTYVKNPNPEQEIAYTNSIKIAKKINADLVLISDPDSDRLGVAYRKNKQYKLINGNENAILIMDYLIEKNKTNSKNNYYLINSFVSTSLPAKMAQENNIKTYITETGFKWIGQKIKNNQRNKEKFLFAFEESYGSLINKKISLDKDAIQGIIMIVLIAAINKNKHLNLGQKLESIYQKYGYVEAKSFSYDLKNETQLKEIKTLFKKIKFVDALFIDYSKGIGDIEANDMLLYQFKNSGNWVSLRPSGTEPKFKIYIHVVEKTKREAQLKFKELINFIETKLKI